MRSQLAQRYIFLDRSSASKQLRLLGTQVLVKLSDARRGSEDFVALQRVLSEIATIDFPDNLFRYRHTILFFPPFLQLTFVSEDGSSLFNSLPPLRTSSF